MSAPARLLLSGYYGFDNFGDEAILDVFTTEWRRRRPQDLIRVLSATPKTARTYRVEAVPRAALPSVRAALRDSDVFISGGGGLLQSATSLRSLLYYAGLLREAKQMGKTSIIFAQGIGPLSFIGREIVRRTCAGVDQAIVRDRASAALLRSLLPALDVREAADPVFLAGEPSIAGDLLQSEGIAPGATLVAVVVRPSRLLARLHAELAAAIDLIAEQWSAQVLLVPFHRPMDVEAAVTLIRRCKSAPVLLSDPQTLPSMSALFKRCTAIVGMRLHSLILATRFGIPFIALPYDPKVDALLERLQYPLPPLQPGNAQSLVRRLWAERASLSESLVRSAASLRAEAAQGFDWLQRAVEGAVS